MCVIMKYQVSTYNPRGLDHDEEALVAVLCSGVEVVEGLESHLSQARLLLWVPVNLIRHVVLPSHPVSLGAIKTENNKPPYRE